MTQLTKVFICILFSMVSIFSAPLVSSANNETVEQLKNKVTELSRRLEQLEPENPKKIFHSEFHPSFPSKVFSINEVIKTGEEIPFEVGIDRPEWKRPVYVENWHSKFWGGRWSNVPSNLHKAMHRMFIGFQSAGIWFDLGHSLGIEEELKNPTNPKAFFEEKVNEKMVIVLMQSEVKKVIRKGNQVVLISEPKRNGLQVITLRYDEVAPSKPDKYTLFKLVTPDGYEYDYTLND
ncbi:hypothetical protein [Alkalihalobacillus deserti]|uniref:hypothetical protein n=1 Tax=Alkalihalobacillus deserti TaxID=2879466 RepID=UPI001D15C80B|nr:hypothetical protein [Alkalihalobacillus deserti]